MLVKSSCSNGFNYPQVHGFSKGQVELSRFKTENQMMRHSKKRFEKFSCQLINPFCKFQGVKDNISIHFP